MEIKFWKSFQNKHLIYCNLIHNVAHNKSRVTIPNTCYLHLQCMQSCDLHVLIKIIYNEHNLYIRKILWILFTILFIYFCEFYQKYIPQDTQCPDVVTQWLMKSSLLTSKLRLSTLKLRLSQSSSQDSVKNMLDNVAIRHTWPGQLECCPCLSMAHWHHPPPRMLASSGTNIIRLHSNFDAFLQDQVSNLFQVQARQNPAHHHNQSLSTNFFSRYHFVFASWLYLLHCSYHVYCPACPK